MAISKAELRRRLLGMFRTRQAIDRTIDPQVEKFMLAIVDAQFGLFSKVSEFVAGLIDFSALDENGRMTLYLSNSDELAQLVASSEYSGAVAEYVAAYEDLSMAASRIVKAGGLVSDEVPQTLIEFVKNRDVRHFEFLNREGIEELDRVFFDSVLAGVPRKETLAELKGAITGEYPWGKRTGLYEWHAGTYARTANMRAVRTFIKDRSDEAGNEWWTYIGPLDSKTRPFCERWIGKALTTQEIENLDNGQTGNVMVDGGGWNCRHEWDPVSREFYETIREEQEYTRDLIEEFAVAA